MARVFVSDFEARANAVLEAGAKLEEKGAYGGRLLEEICDVLSPWDFSP